MSWSVDLAGTPTNVKAALELHQDRLTGEALTEFEEVLPQLVALVDFNAATDPQGLIRLVASGHANIKDGAVQHKYCSINIEPSKTATV